MEKQEEVIAYKAFFEGKNGLSNNLDGVVYNIGEIYTTNDPLQYMKGGFHMCEKLEDCFKFLRPSEAGVELALVRGFGNMYGFDAGLRSYDDTLGYIYICEKMQIQKVYTREEIIKMALEMHEARLKEFLGAYPLTPDEISIIMNHCNSMYYFDAPKRIKKKVKTRNNENI